MITGGVFLYGKETYIISKKRKYLPTRKTAPTFKEFLGAIKEAFLPLCLPIIIIGGICIGIFTPTEAGAVAIVYALILGIVYREMEFSDFICGIKEAIVSTASIMLIVGAASSFAWILTKEQIPQQVTEMILSMISNKYMFLPAVNVFLLIVGMFIEGSAAMIVLVPLLAPVAAEYGINDIHFAMVVIFNMAIGCVTPPVGTLIFVTCGITKCKVEDFVREAVPFYILLIICLMMLTFIPVFSTGIVDLLY